MVKPGVAETTTADDVLRQPRVVIVVVTHDPGSWLGETLASLARQDYGSYGVVVVGTGESTSLKSRVHEALPEAEVVELGPTSKTAGNGRAADEVLAGGSAEAAAIGADYFLFCHDDVVLDSSALTALVEASLDCGADIVGPKLVDGGDPRRLLQMGQTVTATASPVPLLERGEIDQGQYDGRREVFAVTGGAVLVRAATFRRIGGYDEALSPLGEDLSLCWRSRLAGGRVVVTSTARVRSRETWHERAGETLERRVSVRDRARLLLTCCGPGRRRLMLPVLALGMALRCLGALLTGRFSDAGAFLLAWPWNLWNWRSVRIARRQVKRFRRTSDRGLRPLQVAGLPPGFSRWRGVSSGIGDGPAGRRGAPGSIAARRRAAVDRGSRVLNVWTPGTATIACVLAVIVFMGVRHLLTRGVPEIGELLAFDAPADLYGEWATGWRSTGLGSEAPIPTLLAALSALGVLVGGEMDLLRTVLTVGLVPLGVLGAFRMLRVTGGAWMVGSPRAGLGAAVAYAALPLPYTALAAGDWRTLAVYAVAPWLLARLLAVSVRLPQDRRALVDPDGDGEPVPRDAQLDVSHGAPHDVSDDALHDGEGRGRVSEQRDKAAGGRRDRSHREVSRFVRDVLALGLLGGVLAMVVPAAPWLIGFSALGMVAGGLLALELRGQVRLLLVAAGGAAVSLLLQLPWTFGAVRAGADLSDWWGLGRARGDGGTSAVPLDLDSDLAMWALMGAASLAVLVGRDWRLGWAVRGWGLAGVAYGLVWAAGAGELGLDEVPMVAPEMLLVLAGAGMALAVGCGMAAIEHDVAGRSRKLGLRRILAAAGVVALAGASVPMVVGALDGDWDMPGTDFSNLLTEVDRDVADVPSRVLWVGHPDVVPGEGWTTDDRAVSYATTLETGHPGVTELMPGPATAATERLEQAITGVRNGETVRLGRELAPMAVQYIVVPLEVAPSHPQADTPDVPQDLLDGLAGQLDLQRVTLDPSLVLYRNLAFLPEVTSVQLPGVGDVPPADAGWPEDMPTPEHLALFEPVAASPALGDALGANPGSGSEGGRRLPTAASGQVPSDSVLVQSVAESPRWELAVDGVRAERRNAFGWANSFIVAESGRAELTYDTPWRHSGMLLIQGGVWLAAVLVLLIARARVAAAVSAAARRAVAGSEHELLVGSPTPAPVPARKWVALPEDGAEYVRRLAGTADDEDDEDDEHDEPDEDDAGGADDAGSEDEAGEDENPRSDPGRKVTATVGEGTSP